MVLAERDVGCCSHKFRQRLGHVMESENEEMRMEGLPQRHVKAVAKHSLEQR